MSKPSDATERTKRLIGALLRMPPKPHSEMKLGKSRRPKPHKPIGKMAKSPKRKRANAKRKGN